jgi:CheY-like chemotaxis protein
MPGMGGTGFLKRIASYDGKLLYPVLVFTARAATREYFEGINVDGFIAKPCDSDKLLRAMREILARHSPTDGRTVLIGEDDSAVSDAISTAFLRAGYTVERAVSGPEVVERAVEHRPDIVVLKQLLPRMNGNKIAPLLQSLPSLTSVPVLLYDASRLARVDDDQRHLRPASGVSRFMRTEDPGEILSAAQELLRDRQS